MHLKDVKSLPERIKFLRGSMTQKEFAQILGIGKSLISDYEVGRTKPTSEILAKMCELKNVNLNWLLSGKGQPYITDYLDNTGAETFMAMEPDSYYEIEKELNTLREENRELHSKVKKISETLLREIGEIHDVSNRKKLNSKKGKAT